MRIIKLFTDFIKSLETMYLWDSTSSIDDPELSLSISEYKIEKVIKKKIGYVSKIINTYPKSSIIEAKKYVDFDKLKAIDEFERSIKKFHCIEFEKIFYEIQRIELLSIEYNEDHKINDDLAPLLGLFVLNAQLENKLKKLKDNHLEYINTNVYIYMLYELEIININMTIDKASEIAAQLVDKHDIFNYVRLKKSTGFKSWIKKYRSIDKDTIFFHAKSKAKDIINEHKLKSS